MPASRQIVPCGRASTKATSMWAMPREAAAVATIVAVTLATAACGSRDERIPRTAGAPVGQLAAVPATPVERGPDPVAKGVPHGGAIVALAVTEEGDAAITVDDLGSVRLWPTLDGTRAPIPIPVASAPGQLAIAHSGRDLLVAIVDGAGGVQIMRLGLDGALRGRASLPGGPIYEEVALIGDRVIARTHDHALELYEPDGAVRGRIMPEPGYRISDLATRDGRAAAILESEHGADLVWLAVGDTLRWDRALRLPVAPAPELFAIAPGRRRVAMIDSAHTGVHVFDADLMPVAMPGVASASLHGIKSIGFFDDAHVALSNFSVGWWTMSPLEPQEPPHDPWAVNDAKLVLGAPSGTAPAAGFANQRVVTAHQLSLAITDGKRTRYLGYKSGAVGALHALASHVVTNTSSSLFTWLDEDLQAVRHINLRESHDQHGALGWAYGTPVGPRHLVVQRHHSDGKVRLELLDLDRPAEPVLVGLYPAFERFEIHGDLLGVVHSRKLHRFRVDLESSTVTPLLPALTIDNVSSVSTIRLFDPEQAGGIVAVTVGWPSDHASQQALTVYRQHGTQIVRANAERFNGQLLHSLPSGRIYKLDYERRAALHILEGSEVVDQKPLGKLGAPVAFLRDGSRIAFRDGYDIIVTDASLRELWRRPLWGASTMTFLGSSRLVVQTGAGYIALDAATGEERARECGWNFGLHDEAPQTFSNGQTPVCEAPILQ
jgi:hypothetical protein